MDLVWKVVQLWQQALEQKVKTKQLSHSLDAERYRLGLSSRMLTESTKTTRILACFYAWL